MLSALETQHNFRYIHQILRYIQYLHLSRPHIYLVTQ
jgi:hypothetical protein